MFNPPSNNIVIASTAKQSHFNSAILLPILNRVNLDLVLFACVSRRILVRVTHVQRRDCRVALNGVYTEVSEVPGLLAMTGDRSVIASAAKQSLFNYVIQFLMLNRANLGLVLFACVSRRILVRVTHVQRRDCRVVHFVLFSQ